MSYADLSKSFKSVTSQHNVLALVGNGFDIQALSNLGSAVDTRYQSFFYYLQYRNFRSDNCIFRMMETLREEGADDWSDVENAISRVISEQSATPTTVLSDLRSIQQEFSEFLDLVATPSILGELGKSATAGKWTITSFGEFLGDIESADAYNRLQIVGRLNIGDAFNFKFVNFNYTALLDGFIYLDQEQFDPHPYGSSDRNFRFHPNPRGLGIREEQDFHMVAYLVSDVIHPHGIQHTPRSLLFGVDGNPGGGYNLSKPYWAQNEVKYSSLFRETDLFIIFGCSLGTTDRWWWRKIADRLANQTSSDLIIYWRMAANSDVDHDAVKAKFFESAGVSDAQIMEIRNRIVVILYRDGDERAWLNTNPDTAPSWRH